MPWKGEIQMLFGEVNGYCQRHGFRSPDIEDADHHRKTRGLEPAKTIYCGKLRPPDEDRYGSLHIKSAIADSHKLSQKLKLRALLNVTISIIEFEVTKLLASSCGKVMLPVTAIFLRTKLHYYYYFPYGDRFLTNWHYS